LRLGTPALTTRGLGVGEMREIAGIIRRVLKATVAGKGDDGMPSKARFVTEAGVVEGAKREVAGMLTRFPLYPELEV
jgi:glycine hydroxymethyltransferase